MKELGTVHLLRIAKTVTTFQPLSPLKTLRTQMGFNFINFAKKQP
jgi:hypothetical protein